MLTGSLVEEEILKIGYYKEDWELSLRLDKTGVIALEVWTVGIFDDDVSDEVKFRYCDLIGNGETGIKATSILIKEYLPTLSTPDEVRVFWLSLAVIQWKLGRLEDEIKIKALYIIDSGEDLFRWENEKDRKKRKKVLQRAREQLLSPQPAKKKVAKRFVADTNLEAEDVVLYTMVSGKKVVMNVSSIREYPYGDKYPVFELYKWIGTDIPLLEQIKSTEIFLVGLEIFPNKKTDYPEKRLSVIQKGTLTTNIQEPKITICWADFDYSLEEWFNLS